MFKNLNNDECNNLIIISLSIILFLCILKKEHFTNVNNNLDNTPQTGKAGKLAREREHQIKQEEMKQSTKQAQKLPATIIGLCAGGMVLCFACTIVVGIIAVKTGGRSAE